MKKIFDILKIAGLCVGFLLFAACPAAFESDLLGNAQVPEGRGVIQLDVAGPGNRSIFPDEMDNFTWTVTLTADGKDEVTETLEGGAGKVVVDPATWTVVIEAKFNDEIVGRTTIPDVEVEANEVTRLRDVLIKPVTGVDAVQGRLVYSIQLPEDIIAASIFYSADSDDETEIDLLGLEIVVGEDGTRSGSIDLAPGSYLLRAELTNDAKETGMAEVVHIYPGLDSTVSWSSEELFTSWHDVTVTIDPSSTIEVSGAIALEEGVRFTASKGSTVTVKANPNAGYKLAADITPEANGVVLNPVAGAARTWTFTMPGDDVVLSVEYPELGALEIYKGGAHNGLKIVPLMDFPWYHTSSRNEWTAPAAEPNWDSFVTLNADTAGHDGNIRAIKVVDSPYDDAAVGFGLAFDEKVNMENVVALSFWAKSNVAAGINAFFGFGDEGTYTGWNGTHLGVMYTGEGVILKDGKFDNYDNRISADNKNVVIPNDWKRFVVPVPAGEGIRLPDLKRVFTIVAYITNAEQSVLIDDIEFITQDNTPFTGVKLVVPVVTLDKKPQPGLPFDVFSMIDATKSKYVYTLSDGSKVSLHFTTAGWAHLSDPYWADKGFDQITLNEIVSGNAALEPGSDSIIKTETPGDEVVVTFKNGAGILTDPITIKFDADVWGKTSLTLADFSDFENVASPNFGMGYWEIGLWDECRLENGRLGVPFQYNGEANSGFGRRGQSWNLSDPYKSVAFGVRANSTDNNAIGCTYTFTLESGALQYSIEFTVTEAMNRNWVDLLFSLDDFVDAEENPMSAAARENITGWRFNLKTGNDVTNPIIWIDSVLAKLIVPNSGQAGITIDPEADFAGFPENITLYKYGGGELAELEILLAAYAAAKWYVDGTEVGTAGAYTLRAADWSVGTHSLTMEVTVGGARYSKTVDFVVAR